VQIVHSQNVLIWQTMADSLLISAAAPLTAFVLAKLADLGHQQRVAKLLDNAQKEVTFWKSWYEIQKGVTDEEDLPRIKAITIQELTRVQNSVSSVSVTAPRPVLPESVARRTLLLYAPTTSSGWLARLAFFALGSYALLLVCEITMRLWQRSFETFPQAVAVLLAVTVVAFWSRSLAMRIDAGAQRRS
jgi:hypothetical protein